MAARKKRRRRAAGGGTIWQRGGNWWVQWREGGRRRSAKFPTEDLARRVLAKILGDIAAGRAGLEPERAEVPPLSKLAEDWLKRRENTHRSANMDRSRWEHHLAPRLGHLTPDQVDGAILRRMIEEKLSKGRLGTRGKQRGKPTDQGLSSSTVRLLVRLLSSLFSDLVEQGHARHNPVKLLPRATRRLIRPAHDPRTTPFIERPEDIRRVFLALPEPINVAFAIGALAGLRTGEALALRWDAVSLDARRIHVRESVGGPLKDEDSRVVPILDALAPLLREWHVRTGGTGLVVPPMRQNRARCDEHTLGKKLRDALAALRLPRMTWYSATRHTFASQWVIGGGSIMRLRELLGHSTVVVTERYAHLGRIDPGDLNRVSVDLSAPTGKVIPMTAPTAEPAAGSNAVATLDDQPAVGAL